MLEKAKYATIGLVAVLLGASQATAVTQTCTPALSGGNATVSLTAPDPFPQDKRCSTGTSIVGDIFFPGTWVLSDKYNAVGAGMVQESGPGPVLFTTVPANGAASPASYTFAWDSSIFKIEKIVMTLKQGSTLGAFLFDVDGFGGNIITGTWSTSGPGMSANALSNTALFVQGVTVIPAPLGLPLVLSAFGIAWVVRRKSKSVAA